MQQRSEAPTGSSHVLTIDSDGLPLLLLAAVHHPDPELRSRLLGRIDARIAGRRPLVSGPQIRYLLHRARDRPDRGEFDPASVELAVRVARLVFAKETNLYAKKRLLLVAPGVEDDHAGLTLACDPLRIEQAEWGQRGCKKQKRPDTHFRAGAALERLAHLRHRRAPFRVVCRAENGYTLDVYGPTGWNRLDVWCRPLIEAVLISGPSLESFGLQAAVIPEGLRLMTPTPEAILRFSAILARGDLMRMKLGPRARTETYLFIRLCDFDGDESELPCAAYPGETGKPWLYGLPPVEVPIPLSDLLPIMRWAYPREDWLVPEAKQRLLEE